MNLLKNLKIKTKLIIGNIIITIILILFTLNIYITMKKEIISEVHKEFSDYNQSFSDFTKNIITLESEDFFKYKIKELKTILERDNSKSVSYNAKELNKLLKNSYLSKDHLIIFKNKKNIYSSALINSSNISFSKGLKEFYFDEKKIICYTDYIKKYDLWVIFQIEKNILYNKLDTNKINNILSSIKFDSRGYTYIIDLKGNFVVHPAYKNENIYNLDKVNDVNFVNEILKNKKGNIYYTWKNPWEKTSRKKLAVYSFIDSTKWIIVTSGYPDEFYKIINLIKIHSIYMILALLIFNTIFFIYLQAVLDRPIKNLIKKINNLNSKEGHKYIEIKGTDEISIISITFNNLLMTIESYATYLETMVKEKTNKLVKANESLYYLTIYDKLTDIHNRSYIMDFLTNKFNNNDSFTFILFDIDHFKNINDTYGHLGGDFILKNLAQLVKNNLNKDTELGRYGGEEFVIILNLEEKESFEVVEKIRLIIANNKFNYQNKIINITCSFGICTNSSTSKTIEELIDYADIALYQSKNTGRNKTTIFKK